MRRRNLLLTLLNGPFAMSQATSLSHRSLPARRGLQRARMAAEPSGKVVVVTASPGEAASKPQDEPEPVLIDSLDPARPEARTHLFSVPQLMAGNPQWDLAFDPSGRPGLLVTDFGGAVNALSMHTPTHTFAVPPLGGFADLHDPRFVRGPHAPRAFTVLAGDDRVAIHKLLPDGSPGPGLLLASGSKLDNALMLDGPGGPVLLTRRAELGRQRGRFPGVLLAQPLAADLTPAGPAVPVFGEERIFDFDADVTPSGYAVLAITAGGFALARVATGHSPRIEHQADVGAARARQPAGSRRRAAPGLPAAGRPRRAGAGAGLRLRTKTSAQPHFLR